jgi:hypothetical protein
MTIWILALVLLVGSAALGLRQGAIRVAFSFIGILFGTLLAVPLASIFRALLQHLGAKMPGMAWALAPILGFVLVLIAFKVAGFYVHRKVEWFYKYKASETRLSLWTRLNSRLGASVALLNATAYFVLICFYVYNLSYWTVQISSPNSESHFIQLVNQMGQDMQTTGVARAAKAVGKLPDDYYRFADLAGLLRQNPQVTNRLLEYPGLTSLFQRDDLQALGQDTGFTGNWQQQAPIDDLLNNGQVQGLLQNAPLVSQIATILDENYDDLIAYLKTGQSAKYDSEKILGTWDFNLGTSLVFFRQTHAKLKAADLLDIRAQWTAAYANTKLLFAGDNKIYIKQLPDFKANPVVANNLTGDWDAAGTDYKLTVTLNGESKDLMVKSTDGLRLTLKGLENPLTFDHE